MTTETLTKEALATLAAGAWPELQDKCSGCAECHLGIKDGTHITRDTICHYPCRKSNCHDVGWTTTTDADRITAAIREHGWRVTIDTGRGEVGDLVHIWNEHDHLIGGVSANLGYRWPYGLPLALCRALDLVT